MAKRQPDTSFDFGANVAPKSKGKAGRSRTRGRQRRSNRGRRGKGGYGGS